MLAQSQALLVERAGGRRSSAFAADGRSGGLGGGGFIFAATGESDGDGKEDGEGCKGDGDRNCLRPALERHGAALLDRCEVVRGLAK